MFGRALCGSFFAVIFVCETVSPFFETVSLSPRLAGATRGAGDLHCRRTFSLETESYLSCFCTPALVVVTHLRYHKLSKCWASAGRPWGRYGGTRGEGRAAAQLSTPRARSRLMGLKSTLGWEQRRRSEREGLSGGTNQDSPYLPRQLRD